LNKIPNTLLQRVKRLVESGGAEFRDVGLGEILILVAQLARSVDEPDFRRTSDAPTALTRSRKLRAAPLPTLNRPVTFGFCNSQLTVATQSFT
jgi:hypothetical protein